MKNFLKVCLLLAVCVSMTNCNCYKKMAKTKSDVSVVCTPEVLTLQSGEVPVDITIDFPARYFKKKSVIRITPVISFEGGEVAAEPFILQGSKIADNYKIVDFVAGGKITESVTFDYIPEMRCSRLQLRIEAACKCADCDEFVLLDPSTNAVISDEEMNIIANDAKSAEALAILKRCGIDIADGVNTLQADIRFDQIMERSKDDYSRVTTTIDKSDIKYNINSSVVKSSELKSEQMKSFEETLSSNLNNDRIKQSLYSNGYASPDGPEKFNDNLSKARSESAKKAANKLLSEYGIAIDVAAYGEDWEGFKELVASSNIADKGLILEVLSMYDSSTQREAEIKNLAAVFNELKSDILPELRRTQLTNRIDVTGNSDEEMMDLIKAKKYSELSVEEALYCAREFDITCVERRELLESASAQYNDARAYNNLGIIYTAFGEFESAKKCFEKALSLGSKAPELNRNMALVHLALCNYDEAKEMAKGLGVAAKSAVSAMDGDYAPMSKCPQAKNYNMAIAHTQMGNYSAAKSALSGETSADAEYLRAVIASLEGDVKSAQASLESAISMKSDLKAKAKTDVNLKNLYQSGYKL